jgi:hypothetical protein
MESAELTADRDTETKRQMGRRASKLSICIADYIPAVSIVGKTKLMSLPMMLVYYLLFVSSERKNSNVSHRIG